MDKLFDDVARILAAPMPRRRAFRLLGGAVAAALAGTVGSKSLSAFGGDQKKTGKFDTCTAAQLQTGMYNCGNGVANQICCPAGTCCAAHGNDAACCTAGQCTCSNGTCASSTGGSCPKNCTRC
jgi:hypothetical protein